MGFLLRSAPVTSACSCFASISLNRSISASPCKRRLQFQFLKPPKSVDGLRCCSPVTDTVRVRAASLLFGEDGPLWLSLDDEEEEEEEEDEEDALLEQLEYLGLEPQLQLKLQHRMRLKLGKGERLRRKKLFRRRRMRKKKGPTKPNPNVPPFPDRDAWFLLATIEDLDITSCLNPSILGILVLHEHVIQKAAMSKAEDKCGQWFDFGLVFGLLPVVLEYKVDLVQISSSRKFTDHSSSFFSRCWKYPRKILTT
ncbi:hypothetical protein Tsubulata_023529 [Turnera subulata]|uniref:Uncharacterized protein n=1 Tax=Turnera subulata TaxID=218843 RepID=A0A9Q0GFY3_9ROSI|nr:hypothetical protein Tsubulata_023529 [Turnera subulata]